MQVKSLRKLREDSLRGIYLKSDKPAHPGDIEELEQRICSVVFDSSSPLGRCLQAEVDFDLMPFPIMEAMHIAIKGESVSPTLLTVIACHPDSRIAKGGIVTAVIDVHTFDRWLEEAFIAYLSVFLGARCIRRRLATDRRFSRIVDLSTGEVKDHRPTTTISPLLFEKSNP